MFGIIMKRFAKFQFQLFSISIIILIIGFLFHKPLTGEYTFGGPDSLSPSAVHQGITSAEEKYGEYPLWLPWVFAGLPSVHSFQNISDYYFPNYIIKLLKFIGIPSFWNYMFHFILAGMGVFTILRKLRISRYSSLFGGLSFALMPYLITMVVHGHGSQMMTTAWIPWIIWAILRLYDKASITNLGILGFIIGLQMQRAHVQIVYYSWMAAGLLIIMLLCKIYDKPNNNPKWIIYAGIAFILGLCMAMWIYLPAINYAPYSIRGAGSGGGTGFEYATSWSFSFSEMATFFIPSYYGFGGITYWGSVGVMSNGVFHPFTDYPNYMGIIVLTLAVIGILFHERKIKWYFVTIAFLALLISFGNNFFLYHIFYDYFPYFNKFRVPHMILILTQFSVSILAGFGLDLAIKCVQKNNVVESLKKLSWVLAIIVIIILVLKYSLGNSPDFGAQSHPTLNSLRIDMINNDIMTGLLFLIISGTVFYIARLGWITHQVLAGIIISLSIIDIALVDLEIIEPDKKSYRQSTMIKKSLKSTYLSEDEVIQFLKQDKSKYRVLPLGSLGNENRWSAFQIESVMGYHPAKLFRYNKLKDEVGWNSLGILQMLNVKYVITLEDLPHPAFEHIFTGKLFHQGKYVKANVYKFKYVLPRIYFAQELNVIPNLEGQLNALRNPRFNPQKIAIVEQSFPNIEYSADAIAEIIYWSPDKIDIQIEVPTEQLLVFSEIYYPEGWKITSHPNWDIHPVNTILRGIYIPAGQHTITMEFIPNDIFYGTAITWTSTGIFVMLILVGLIRKRKEDESQTKAI